MEEKGSSPFTLKMTSLLCFFSSELKSGNKRLLPALPIRCLQMQKVEILLII